MAGPGGKPQAPHINVGLFARGMLKRLFTRIYFAGEPANASDPILALVPPERLTTLLAKPDPAKPGSWRFDIHLQGPKRDRVLRRVMKNRQSSLLRTREQIAFLTVPRVHIPPVRDEASRRSAAPARPFEEAT